MTNARLACALLAAAVALAAGGASAIDLTGTWTSKKDAKCKGLTQTGDKFGSKVGFATLEISQAAEAVTARFEGYEFDGAVYGDDQKDQGQGLLVKCTDAASAPEVRLALQIVKASAFAPNRKGVSGKLTTLVVRGDLLAGTVGVESCRVTWERTSTTDPAAPGCP
jgi:hypothetical protein